MNPHTNSQATLAATAAAGISTVCRLMMVTAVPI